MTSDITLEELAARSVELAALARQAREELEAFSLAGNAGLTRIFGAPVLAAPMPRYPAQDAQRA